MIYTFRERTVKNYKIQDAINAADARLKGIPMCTNALNRRDVNTPITLVELNELADRLVDDSHYHRV